MVYTEEEEDFLRDYVASGMDARPTTWEPWDVIIAAQEETAARLELRQRAKDILEKSQNVPRSLRRLFGAVTKWLGAQLDIPVGVGAYSHFSQISIELAGGDLNKVSTEDAKTTAPINMLRSHALPCVILCSKQVSELAKRSNAVKHTTNIQFGDMPIEGIPVLINSVVDLHRPLQLDSGGNFDNQVDDSSKMSSSSGSTHSRSSSSSTAASSVESQSSQRLLPTMNSQFATVLESDQKSFVEPIEREYLVKNPKHVTVDSEEKLLQFLEHLNNVEAKTMDIMIDGEWYQGQMGIVLTILEVKFSSKGITYCMDLVVLGPAAFDTSLPGGRTFAEVLEDPDVPIGIYDARGDVWILFNQYGIVVEGVIDVQILFLIAHFDPYTARLPGLANAVRALFLNDMEMQDWLEGKRNGRHLCNELDYSLFLKRPLHPELQKYASGDTEYMDHIYAFCMAQQRMKIAFLHDFVLAMSKRRVTEVLSPEYDTNNDGGSGTPAEYLALTFQHFGLETPVGEDSDEWYVPEITSGN